MKIKLENTLLGRTLRRLAGEEKGAVMMEYVVLGVLVVAAVVGMVIAFGNRTNKQLQVMIEAEGGEPTLAGATATAANANAKADIATATAAHNAVNGGEMPSN